MKITNFQHPRLSIKEFTTLPHQSWVIWGSNDSGIETFLELLQGRLSDYQAGSVELPDNPGVISFAGQQELFEEELRNDDSDFLDRPDPGTLVREFLPQGRDHLQLLQALGLAECFELGYRQLSSGQSRKLLMLRELVNGVDTLILQNPFDGLDEKSCSGLNEALSNLAAKEITVILLINAKNDIPDWCSHLAVIHGGRMSHTGTREQILHSINHREIRADKHQLPLDQTAPPGTLYPSKKRQRQELIVLEDGFAGYGEKTLFTGLNLELFTGDHTIISGPNGCGKSTLLDIITGDNPKCYANRLRIFGNRRGSGESIWELKQQMGIVSPSLHRDHRSVGTALHVVLSGFFDSIGLYQKVHNQQIKAARAWLNWINLEDQATEPFRHLSFAQQRLVLIARGLVKCPKLLILDEPTQGLDDDNRELLLSFLQQVAQEQLSTILFVSHRRDEHRPFFTNHIRLDSYAPAPATMNKDIPRYE